MPARGAPLGNTFGAKDRLWRKALQNAMAREYGTVDDGLRAIATKVVKAAAAGDQVAWKEIGDRMDGKPAQAIVGDSSGDPVQVVITATQAKL